MTIIINYPEGATPLDRNEIEGLKFPHVSTQGELNQLEQTNIETGLRWLERQKKPDVLSESFVIALHKRLFGDVWEWAGTFRRTGKNVGVDPIHIGVELRTLLDNARYWREHGTYSPVEGAVRFHHRLVFIHPFPNGNGRHARIMADALLEKIYSVAPIDWAGGHDLQAMNERRKQYLDALRAADRGDFGPLMVFVGNVT